jgi:2-methylcitrate dehydratase
VGPEGFDLSTSLSYAVAAGVAKALKLNHKQTANAIAATVAANSSPHVSRVGGPSRCKNALYSNSPFSMAQAVLLAMSSITDDHEASEANLHLIETVLPDLELDWGGENLEAVRRTIVKKFNSEIYSQSALEAILYLRERRPCHPDQIERIELDTFDVAYDLLTGNEKGVEYQVRAKAEAYSSLPYLMAVMLLDGKAGTSQYEPERILREDVQSLMRRVVVRPVRDFSDRFPEEMPARVQIFLRDGQILTKENRDYEGYFTRPLSWERAVEKFKDLTVLQTGYKLGEQIIEKVLEIEDIEVRELTGLLAGVAKSSIEKVREKVFTLPRHKQAA